MAHLKTCNPAQAKRVWESMPNPSTRRVARKLRQAGRPVSHGTVHRWQRQGWRALDEEPRHPLEIARERLSDALPVLSGSPLTTVETILQESADHDETLDDD